MTSARRQLAAVAALALLAGLVLAPAAAAQCAMCKTALTASPEGRSIGAQFNRAILIMIAAPYLVMGALAGVIFRSRLQSTTRRFLARLRFAPPSDSPRR